MDALRGGAAANAETRASMRGQALAEFAIILLVLMLLVLGVFDLSRAVYVRSVVANAAREGARFAAVEPLDADNTVVSEATIDCVLAKAEAGSVALSRDDVSVTWPGEDVQVEVSYVFRPATGFILEAAGIGSGGIELRGDSTMRREK